MSPTLTINLHNSKIGKNVDFFQVSYRETRLLGKKWEVDILAAKLATLSETPLYVIAMSLELRTAKWRRQTPPMVTLFPSTLSMFCLVMKFQARLEPPLSNARP